MPEIQLKPRPAPRSAKAPKAKKTSPSGEKIPFWSREISLGKTFPGKEKFNFFQVLSTLLGSGLSIRESLAVLLGQNPKKKIRDILTAMNKQLEQGESLSAALQSQAKHFTEFEIASIRMGERSGQLQAVLAELARFHEKRLRLRRKLSQALTYPIAVVVVAIVVTAILLIKVVPQFAETFSSFGANLPAFTLFVLSISEFMQAYWLIVLVSVIGALAVWIFVLAS